MHKLRKNIFPTHTYPEYLQIGERNVYILLCRYICRFIWEQDLADLKTLTYNRIYDSTLTNRKNEVLITEFFRIYIWSTIFRWKKSFKRKKNESKALDTHPCSPNMSNFGAKPCQLYLNMVQFLFINYFNI